MEKTHEHPSHKLFTMVWVALLVLTIVEVILAYRQLAVATMLIILMSLSVIKAGLIIAYFMHLRYERVSLVLTLMPMLIICICLLASFFPDSLRVLELGTK